MSDVLYFVLIYPLEKVLGFILQFFNLYVQSFGMSIILLSLFVNLFLLKLFFIADNGARKHHFIKEKLELKIKEFKRVFKGGELYTYIHTLYRQNHYHPIFALKALGGLALQVPFFVAVVFLLEFHSQELQGLSFGIIKDLSKQDHLIFGVNFLPLLMSSFTLINVFLSSRDKFSRIQGIVITLIFLVLLYQMPSALLLYWTTSMFFALCKSLIIYYAKQRNKENEIIKDTSTKSSSLGFWGGIFTPYASLDSQTYFLYRNLSIFIILNICLLIFIYNPFTIYASDVSQFNPNEMPKTLSVLIGSCLLTSFFLIYLTSFFYQTRLLKIGVFGFGVIFIIGIVYNFILNYNIITGESYSQIDNFTFKNPHNISGYLNRYVDLLVGIASCLFFFFILYKIKRLFFRFLLVFLIAILVISVINLIKINYDVKNIAYQKDSQINENGTLSEYHKTLLRLSSNNKNILIVLSDAFSGSHLKIIFEQFPELKKHFDGFIYYPNSLSLDGHTALTAHTILTGHSTSALNNREKSMKEYHLFVNHRLKDILKQFSVFYKVDVYNLPHLSSQDNNELSHHLIGSYQSNDDYYQYFLGLHQEYKIALRSFKEDYLPVGELISIGIFNFSPYTIRTQNYTLREGSYSWLFGKNMTLGSFINGVKNVSELESIVKNFQVSETKKPTLKYIHTMATHYPYVFDGDCKITSKIKTIVPKKYLHIVGKSGHYESEVCAVKSFINLLKFLKTENIYNNTMIIFVSDHSYDDVIPSLYAYGNNPNPLIMIKDFNSTGEIKTSNLLMSNADIASIICDIGMKMGCKNVEENILKNYPKHRVLTNTLNVHWTEKSKIVNYLIFEKIFKIKDNLFDPKNWEDITNETSKKLKGKEN